MPEPLVYTVEEAATLLAIGRTAAYSAVARGEIPCVRIGRTLRVPRHALEELLNVNGHRAADEARHGNGAGPTAPSGKGVSATHGHRTGKPGPLRGGQRGA